MRGLLFGLILGMFISAPAGAQGLINGRVPDIVQEPICFQVVNKAPYGIFGTFMTDLYERPDGIRSRHRSNFRLKEPGTIDEDGYPADSAEFCTYGPFFPGRKLEVQIKTLVPVFSCRTRIDQGPLIIRGERKREGGTNTWIECFE